MCIAKASGSATAVWPYCFITPAALELRSIFIIISHPADAAEHAYVYLLGVHPQRANCGHSVPSQSTKPREMVGQDEEDEINVPMALSVFRDGYVGQDG